MGCKFCTTTPNIVVCFFVINLVNTFNFSWFSLKHIDDINIEVGKLRIRGKGSPGGHNGLKDIQAELGGDTYDRIRFGAGGDYSKGRQIEHVLGQWAQSEEIEVVLQKDKACKAIESWIVKGLNGAMNEFSS